MNVCVSVCVCVCVSARQVGDKRETLNDSHVRHLLYETSDLINRSEEDARRQPEGHHSSLRSAARMHARACAHTLQASRGRAMHGGTLLDRTMRQWRMGHKKVEAHSNREGGAGSMGEIEGAP